MAKGVKESVYYLESIQVDVEAIQTRSHRIWLRDILVEVNRVMCTSHTEM